VATILTGRYPSGHGANRLLHPVAPGVPLLAESLAPGSIVSAGIVSNHFLEEKYGLHKGFGHWDASIIGDSRAITSGRLTDAAVAWLASTGNSPFLLFLFHMDPHYEYMRQPGARLPEYDGPVRSGQDIWELRDLGPSLGDEDLAYLRALYAGEASATDRAAGRLLRWLAEAGRLENTTFLVTADHGEEFLEHGWIGHTRNLHANLLEVPLIVYGPGRIRPELRTDAAMLVDVAPTLLQALGQAVGRSTGRGLLGPDRSPRDLYAEVTYDPQAIPPQDDPARDARRGLELTKLADQRSLSDGRWKVVVNRLTDAAALYDLAADPGETRDVAAEHPDVVAELTARFPDPGSFEVPETDAVAGITPEEIERLRNLGYVR
jgi:arylsulfatase A-like enzyme